MKHYAILIPIKAKERNIEIDMRSRIFEIIEIAHEGDKASTIYDSLMMTLIIASVIPLAFKETNVIFEIVNIITAFCFVVDYLLRLSTADLRQRRTIGRKEINERQQIFYAAPLLIRYVC